MVTIQVVSRASGNPISGSRVGIYVGLDGVTHEQTNSSGEAHFSSLAPGNYEVYVDGKAVHKGRVEGRLVIYV